MGTIIGFATLSAVLLFSFIIIGVAKFGLRDSYSGYAPLWEKAVPMNNLNLWSVVTCVAAFLICPVLLELGTASALQFLGFLVPVYLIVVTLTPDYYKDKKQFRIHSTAALLCLIGAMIWCLFVMHTWKVLLLVFGFILILALATGTLKTSAVFWGEMFAFLSVYITIFLALI